MKNSIKFLALLIAGFGYYSCSDAMLHQPASVRTKNIVNTIKNNEVLSEQQIHQLFLLSLHSALSNDQKAILTSILNDFYDKKSVSHFANMLDEIALFFEQWEKILDSQEQNVNLIAGEKRQPIDLSQDNIESEQEPAAKRKKVADKVADNDGSDEDLRAIEIAKIETLKCVICSSKYNQTAAMSKEISCCTSYHLFCTDCVKDWKKKKNTCPQASCKNKISHESDCYTNDTSEENYAYLRQLLQSCTHADAAKEQVLNLLLLKKEGAPVDLQLPQSDSDSDNDENCFLCKSEIGEDEIFVSSCDCEISCHKVCLDALREDNTQCDKCHKPI